MAIKSAIKAPDAAAAASLLRVLGDSNRVQILAMLRDTPDEVCVCEFTARLPLNQPTVSHHLRALRETGLVRCERRGTWIYYRLDEDALDRIREALDIALGTGG